MLSLRLSSFALAGALAVSAMGCGDSAGAGGTGGGNGGSGGDTTTASQGGGGAGSDTTGGGGAGGGGGSGGSTAAEMTLTSPDITEGSAIPVAYTCGAKNVSPQLVWTAGPPDTKSYALIFRDLTFPLTHWTIFNIPPTETGLPTNVEKTKMPANVPGARQLPSYDGATYGYLGPCPPEEHTYEFTVYALKSPSLPFVGPGDPTAQEVEEEIESAKIAEATLTGTYTP